MPAPMTTPKSWKIGTRVRFLPDFDEHGVISLGTITEMNWMSVKVEWDDGQVGIIHKEDYATLEVA